MNEYKPPIELRLFTEKEVQERTGYRHTWLWKAVKSGAFPRPLKHGRSIRFVAAEVEGWIKARIADRDGTAGPRLLFTEREIADALGISVYTERARIRMSGRSNCTIFLLSKPLSFH